MFYEILHMENTTMKWTNGSLSTNLAVTEKNLLNVVRYLAFTLGESLGEKFIILFVCVFENRSTWKATAPSNADFISNITVSYFYRYRTSIIGLIWYDL